MFDYLKLGGQAALVTGAGRGIGAACAKMLADAGASVLATDVDEGAARDVAAQIVSSGGKAEAMRHDVTSEADWQAASARILEAFGGWDVLVNNAGIYIGGLLEKNTLEQLRKLNAVNIESVFLGTRAAAIAMKPGGAAGKGGAIVNLSSAAGLMGVPGHSAYGSTKGSVRLYSRHSAIEFATLGYGIRVNSVHPGVIETEMGDKVYEDFVEIGIAPDLETAAGLIRQITPMQRPGTAEEVAKVVTFLASDASSYMTGAEIAVDGGATAA